MTIKHRLASGVLLAVLLVAAVGIVSLAQLHRVARSLREEIPAALAAARSTPQDSLSQRVRYYDEIRTQSARNFAFTRDPAWERRYQDAEPQLDDAIKEARNQGDAVDREFFSSIDAANLALVEMEHKSIELVHAGRAAEALAILESREYRDQKDRYQNGLTDYAHRRGRQYDDALGASTERVRSAHRRAGNLLKSGTLLVLGVVTAAVLLAAAVGLAILRSITVPLERLRTAVAAIRGGNLKAQIDVDANDEMGQLAASVREMVTDLRNTTVSMDSLNREAAERQRAEAELLAINRVLAAEITQREQAEAEQRESEQKFRVLFEVSSDAIMTLEPPAWRFTSGNPATVKMFNARDEAQFVSKSLWEFSPQFQPDGTPSENKAKAMIGRALQEGSNFFEWEHRRADGEVFPATVLFTRVTLGEKVFLQATVRDITEGKRAEQKQAQLLERLAEINQELKDFAYVVSHDLKAPLRAIKTLAEWLVTEEQDKLDEQSKENLQLLGSRVDRMQSLIDGILQYSRVGRTEQGASPVHLDRLVPEIIENLGAPAHVAIRVENELPTVGADTTRITQVFQNLLSNAIKYMDKQQGDITVACVEEDGFWKFSVRDTGPGIEPNHFDRVFKLFQTLGRREDGESHGVGLAITKKIVERYGGTIWVESEVGQGSTFFFTWPRSTTDTREDTLQTCAVA